MTKENLQEIQEIIGYSFKNPMLLQQAFIRRSYTQEHPDFQNNEVLEFIGDKVLDAAVVRHLACICGKMNERGEYISSYNEGKLTDMKKRLVSKTMLAHRVDVLGLNKYLIMGNGDCENNVQEDTSVKEDLFEAILGAIAIDCSWLEYKVDRALEFMLPIAEYLANGFDTDEENYVERIQEWCQKNHKMLPEYEYVQSVSFSLDYPDRLVDGYECRLIIKDIMPDELMSYPIFAGRGSSKQKARMLAAKQAYDFLISHDLIYTMADEVGDPELDKAINQLQELAQKGYVSMPKYNFGEDHDENGNPLWYCECHVSEYEPYFWARNSSKKDAKKSAALGMLKFILGGGDKNPRDK